MKQRKPNKNGGPHRTKTQREADLIRIAQLDRQGYNQTEIAEFIGVSQVQVSYDLQKLRRRYQADQFNQYELESVKELTPEQKRANEAKILEMHREMFIQLTQEWERSKQDAKKVVIEDAGEKGITETTTIEGRLADVAYINAGMKVLEKIAEMMGIVKPAPTKAADVNVTTNIIDWNTLAQAIPPQGTIPDTVEAEIAKVAALPPPSSQENGTEGMPYGLKEIGTNGEGKDHV